MLPGEVKDLFYQVLHLVRGRASSLEFLTPWSVFLTTRVGKGEEVVISSVPSHNRQVEGSVLLHSLFPGSPPTSLPPGSPPLCCLGKKYSVQLWALICSTPGHGHLGRWDSGSLIALIPCCTGCWAIGKQRHCTGVGKQSELWEGQSWLRGSIAYEEVGVIGFSGSWTSRYPLGVTEELRNQWGLVGWV